MCSLKCLRVKISRFCQILLKKKKNFTDKFLWSRFQPCIASIVNLKFSGRKLSHPHVGAYSTHQPMKSAKIQALQYQK